MKVMTSRIPQFIGAGLVGLALSGVAQADHHGMKADIVDTAVEAGQFETLVAAVQAAGLVETLKGEGPFTVFAPTDEAFAALPEGTVDDLLKPENRDTLASVLTYHVVPGKVTAEDAMAADSATTVQGQDITITTMDGQVMVNQATVIQPDVEASNGVIHVIDGVLMPE
ncbi:MULTISPECIES: fasciclin domain-containing protein [Halomonas]|uniref:Beta-Ig-H3/fasciclin n=1 Tax=Halomonas halophila TaxID=29573 RepID=A0ABQ0U923_9GAMM|nr:MULTISPECIES: fasciclin domain-containing protein [Halomonas]MDR5890771.1 fasciclin domain-containing protein [Halomonas salina]RAH38999.1 fasciclin domain-containing protein [Halomonas sp. SL1]WJY08388.1 fasciclin domain-containing protein [Halomonas halophila]GEK73534.1 beta-Ig-H3/fasciclin [Halomonas halophila]